MRRRAVSAATLIAAALALAACGSSSDSGTGSDTGASTTASTSTSTPPVVVQASAPGFNAERIYETAAPGVVTITSVFPGSAPSLFGSGPQAAVGAGFVTSEDGYIATNAHVVTDIETGTSGPVQEAKQVYVQFTDRNRVPATVVGFDLNDDVALIKIDPDGLDLQPLELATDEALKVGQPVAAIGSPFEQNESLSVGVVSALDRSLESFTKYRIEGAIQTDASINPGNSGGPLLDAAGRVIGINRQIQTTTGSNQGVAFAIPIDLASRSIDALRNSGEVTYAYIGLRTSALYPQLAQKLDLPVDGGALVGSVINCGPAQDAGIRGSDTQVHFQGIDFKAGGDVIVAVNDKPVVDASDLPRYISRLSPGDVVHVDLIRDGQKQTVDVTLAERPTAGSDPCSGK